MEFNDDRSQENNNFNNNNDDNRKNYIDLIYDNNEQNNDSEFKCYNPRSDSHGLVIVTSKKSNYDIKFNGNKATISIPEENFNMTTSLSSLQIVTNNRNNILYVKKEDSGEFRVITNNYIKLPYFKIANASKEANFIETIFNDNKLNLNVQNNEISFIHKSIPIVNNNVSTEEINNIIEPVITSEPATENIVEPTTQPINESISEINESQELIQDSIQKPEKNESTNTTQTEIKENNLKTINKENNVNIPENSIDTQQLDAPDNSKNRNSTSLNKDTKKSTKKIKVATDTFDFNNIKDNNNLIISESDKKVFLPYTVKDLNKKFKNNKNYKSIEDVINSEYIIPIDNYKNPAKSRFKEAYNLIKKKEHGTFREAMDLGFELVFQSNLHPAIITACKNLDELDIYLDCLDDNDVDNFDCFNITYDVPPMDNQKKSKNKKEQD